jgi:hypothetical protein
MGQSTVGGPGRYLGPCNYDPCIWAAAVDVGRHSFYLTAF